ncbi:MAG: radical SAM protein [Elusimicrobia bacterium]|nr:radical SAM protein [Elusimicrobiota bacterium]
MAETIRRQQSRQGRLDPAERFPKVVLLDTVSHCNLRCSMCVHSRMKRKQGVMPWPLFTKIVDEVAREDPSARVWLVFFGEPLILKNFKPGIFDMIAYAKKAGLKDVVINSNANLLDEASSRRLIEAGLDAIYIGIDACSAKTYAKVRVGGDYEKTVKNVLRLLELKAELKSSKPEVFVQFVEMPVNSAEKAGFVRFWSGKGATVKIRPKVSWAGEVEAENLVLGNESRWPCYWAMRTMSVTDSGKVVLCAVDLDAKFIAGDVTERSLKEVWNGSLKAIRDLHQDGQWEKLPKVCARCRDWQSARAEYHGEAKRSKATRRA